MRLLKSLFSRGIHKIMEHPIPRNVTSFEFHLIGDMTLKQFAYLAAGLIIGYLTFILVFSIYPLVAIPIIVCSVGLGSALAFLPILDRPLDHWVMAFLKAIFSPTKGVWGKPVFDENLFNNRLGTYLSSLQPTQPTIATIPTNIQNPIIALQPTPPPSTQPTQPTIPTISPPKQPQKQLSLTSFPNVINGVISDEMGNLIEGVIVIIHSVDGIPVRALKTNKLGQFSGATPLLDGVYSVTFEKEGFELGTIQISLKGVVLPPLLISIKKAHT